MAFGLWKPQDPKQRYRERMDRMSSTMDQVRQQPKPSVSMEGGTTGRVIEKENALQHEGYMSIVRGLACRRCGYLPPEGEARNQFAHSDQGKGKSIKTDCRRGASLCGPHGGVAGCHWVLGTSGQYPKEVRRQLEDEYAASTRAEVLRLGAWPKSLPLWSEKP